MPVPAVWLLPICATKLPTLTLPWLAQRNCTLEAVDCSSNCAPNADSSGRSLQCNHCRCRMCDFCVAELGDPKRPRRPQAYHATLAHKTTSWHESKQQRRGKHLRPSNATEPEASGKHHDAAWAAGNEMWHSMGVRTSYSIMAVCLTLLILLVILQAYHQCCPHVPPDQRVAPPVLRTKSVVWSADSPFVRRRPDDAHYTELDQKS